ncbi:hydroxymethylglutaryl-CoA lyase [Robertmurraya andreesenii]|uniref:Hydroxymethylglutaryl-CoA lyase n=1 Tax=Anoxybacillus andreesenii TaxID=1325932 RepID=A0ABT9V0T5_9BACL|nr:hydroxymethylglutaryl-CoA lyase [Robertmurraya andreesenii]MDQ0154566.1 hydroxymethylglutaryl-CoA lyase [Robertmurraya andreesenii]
MIFPKEVEVIEVGPRDGLQNEPNLIPLEKKKKLIKMLSEAGFSRIETASFVHPKWVPQMANSEEMAEYSRELAITYLALTPNQKALERAIAVQAPQIAVFIGATETFNRKNINRSIDQSLEECKDLFERAKKANLWIRGYVSMAFSCPYEGEVAFEKVRYVCDELIRLGADEISIGDTTGKANPKAVYERFSRLRDLYPHTTFVAHFHDTEKMALANVVAAMQAGITKFDSSIGGLGGCPYSPGATGNVATEELVHMLEQMGCSTNLDLHKLREASRFAKTLSSRIQ